MSARIYPFPEGGRAGMQRREPTRLAGFDYTRFGKLLPLRVEDAAYIVERAASRDPAARHRANELLACARALRYFKSHPQGQVALQIIQRLRGEYLSAAGPHAA